MVRMWHPSTQIRVTPKRKAGKVERKRIVIKPKPKRKKKRNWDALGRWLGFDSEARGVKR